MNKRILLFDLDGTLIDSVQGIQLALNRLLSSHGFRHVTQQAVRTYIGDGATVLVDRALHAAAPERSWDLAEETRGFLSHYARTAEAGSVLFEGVGETLEDFKQAGHLMALCTNKPQQATLRVLRALGVETLFDVVVGGDLLPVRKPDPEHLRYALRMIATEDHPALMVGDSAADIRAARAAGIPSVLVTYGYAQRSPASLGADHVIATFPALKAIVADLS